MKFSVSKVWVGFFVGFLFLFFFQYKYTHSTYSMLSLVLVTQSEDSLGDQTSLMENLTLGS